jgi:hypothetical protein
VTGHDPAGYDGRARPVLVSPAPHLETTAVMLAVSRHRHRPLAPWRVMIILRFLRRIAGLGARHRRQPGSTACGPVSDPAGTQNWNPDPFLLPLTTITD